MAQAKKNIAVKEKVWPAEINLKERMPINHNKYPDHLRYKKTRADGSGRMDMTDFTEVPQYLVDAALAKEAQVAEASLQSRAQIAA